MKQTFENYYLNRLLGLMIFVIIHLSSSFGQSSNRFSFHQLTPEEGLSQASNDFIFHDSKGFIWLSSIEGLNKFDGQSVKVYKSIPGDSTSLLGNIITSNFFEDDATNIWFTTYEGIHCYLRQQDHFIHFQLKNQEDQLLQQDYSSFYLDPQQQLWVRIGVGQKSGLFLFDIKNYQSKYLCKVNGQRHFPLIDKNRHVKKIIAYRFGSSQKGIEVLTPTPPFSTTSFFDGKEIDIPLAYTFHVNKKNDHQFFLSTKIGLIHFDLVTRQFSIFDQFKNQTLGQINSSIFINDSTLWVATNNQGILLFNTHQKKFEERIAYEPFKKYGFNIKSPNQLFLDQKENVWVSSKDAGVNYANLKKRKFESPKALIDKNISAIFESSRGEIFISHSLDSIGYYHHPKAHIQFSPTPIADNAKKSKVKFFFEDQENIFAVTSRYLMKWNRMENQFKIIFKFPTSILFVYKNKNDRILISSFGGIFQLKITSNNITFTKFKNLKNYQNEIATILFEDIQGRLYFGVDASKLIILKPEADHYIKLQQIEGIGLVKAFFEQQNTIWVATSTGLLKINAANLEHQLLTEKDHGIPNENFYSIIPDDENTFWLSSNRGIIRYFPHEKKHRRYTLVDGLQASEFNTQAFLKTSQGEIWMGGTSGINKFFPEKIADLPTLPQAQITKIQVNDSPHQTPIQVEELDKLTLEYSENTISFNFVSIDYADPKNNLLQYQMENRDNDWVLAEKSGFARYSNLPSGEYLFKIKAANSDGVWNETPRSIKIFIKTPWYRTWWFYTACFVSLIGIIYGLLMYRLQQALKIERLRVKISSDLHDDVGGLLAGLMMQTELLEITGTEERKPKLARISALSRKAMSRMRDTVWAIDSRKDKFKNLLDRIREHAAETLEPKNINWDLKNINIPLERNMNSQVRQNLYLICKEAITNTAKHSKGNQLNIVFEKNGRNGFILNILDNGKIENSQSNSSGLGLSNLKMRAQQIGGQLSIDQNDGFKITLILNK